MYPNWEMELLKESMPAPTAVFIKVKIASLKEPCSSFPKALYINDLWVVFESIES